MSEQEYNETLSKIEADYKQAKKELHIKYGKSQAKYSVGDIIGKDPVIIKIERVTVYKSFGLPEPVYHGVELKKDLTPKKSGNKGAIYGNRGVTLYEKSVNEKG